MDDTHLRTSPDEAAIAELEQQLRQGTFFVQASLEQNGQLTNRLDAFLTGLLDLLVEDGVVDIARLQTVVERNRRLQAEEKASKLAEGDGLAAWPSILVRAEEPDQEGETDTVPVDCAARMHVCKSVCCSLRFPLSPSEIEAGVVKFELGHPYLVRHSAEGYCVHNDRATGACTVYDDRPQVCRSYSCANDGRIWRDFDNMVLNEEYLASRVPRQFHFKPATDGVPVAIRPRTSPPPAQTVLAGGEGER